MASPVELIGYSNSIENSRITSEQVQVELAQDPQDGVAYHVEPEPAGLQFTNNVTEVDEHSLLTETESEIDLEEDMASIASSLADRLTWRGRMQVALHSTWFHLFVVILVLFDSLFVLIELLLEVGAFNNVRCTRSANLLAQAETCHFDRDFGMECAAPFTQFLCNDLTDPEQQSFANCTQRVNSLTEICVCGYRDGSRECIPFGSYEGINPGVVFHYLSLVILSIFILEFLLKLIAFRMKFFTHRFEVFDACIVLLSFVLDVASIVDEEGFEVIAQLVILLRLWRIVRVVNGIILSSKSQNDNALHEAKGEARKVIHMLHKTRTRLTEELEEKENILKILEHHKITYTPTPKTIPLKSKVEAKADAAEKAQSSE